MVRSNNDLGGAGFDSESVQSLWREALVLREMARDGSSKPDSRARRSEAEAARRAAEQEALKATEEYCRDLRSRAESELESAQKTLADAERLKADISADLERRSSDVEAEYQRARTARKDAESYASGLRNETEERSGEIISNSEAAAEKMIADAAQSAAALATEAAEAAALLEKVSNEKAEKLLAQAEVDAEHIRESMREATAAEIRSLVADLEAARAIAAEEAETQRILSETAAIRATSPGLAAKASIEDEPEEPIILEVEKPKKARARKTTRKRSTRTRRKAA